MSMVMVGTLPLAWHRNVGVSWRYLRPGLGGRRRRGLAGPASGYADFSSYNSAVCLPLAGANVCPPPYDPACIGPASAAVTACQTAWVTDPTSCHNIMCDASGQPAISYQPYTTPSGQAATAVGYNTTSGFVPVSVSPPAAKPAPAAVTAQSSSPAPGRPVSYHPSLSFTNSRGGTTLQPGDTWTIAITGAPPNSPVTVTGNSAGNLTNSITTMMGSTDSNGNYSLSGAITADQAGVWSESWRVGGNTVGSFSFTVVVPPAAAPAPAPAPSTTPAASTGTISSPYYLGPSPPPAAGTTTGTTDGTTAAAGVSGIPTWVWLAGAGLLAVMAFKGK